MYELKLTACRLSLTRSIADMLGLGLLSLTKPFKLLGVDELNFRICAVLADLSGCYWFWPPSGCSPSSLSSGYCSSTHPQRQSTSTSSTLTLSPSLPSLSATIQGRIHVFFKGGGPSYRSTSKKGGPRGGPTLGPMLKSLHRGPKGGARPPGPPPLDPLLPLDIGGGGWSFAWSFYLFHKRD